MNRIRAYGSLRETILTHWLVVLLFAISNLSAEVVAFDGTLADYLALDDEGVTFSGANFSEFEILPRQEGAAGFRPDFIDVTPLVDDFSAPGFRFDVMDGATADDFFELRFSFLATGILFESVNLSLATVNIRSDSNGGADVLVDLSDGNPGSETLFTSLVAFAAPGNLGELEVDDAIPEKSDLHVEVDAVLDGGGMGRPGEVVASLGSIEVRFGKAEAPPVEPRVSVRAVGLLNTDTFFVEFVSSPATSHEVVGSDNPVDGFSQKVPLTSGDGRTDDNGFGRVEFNVSSLGTSHFFRIEIPQ